MAAVAEQAAEWYAVTATPQNINETVQGGGPRHKAWTRVVAMLAGLDKDDPDTLLSTNLLIGLFAAHELANETDASRALGEWQMARQAIAGALS